MSALELRERIISFINDEISLSELEDWMIPNLANLIDDPNAGLVYAVELVLAEFADGIRSEHEAKGFLKIALQENNTVRISIREERIRPPELIFSSSNQIIKREYNAPMSGINPIVVRQVLLDDCI